MRGVDTCGLSVCIYKRQAYTHARALVFNIPISQRETQRRRSARRAHGYFVIGWLGNKTSLKEEPKQRAVIASARYYAHRNFKDFRSEEIRARNLELSDTDNIFSPSAGIRI